MASPMQTSGNTTTPTVGGGSCYDPLDMETFLDFDQLPSTASSRSSMTVSAQGTTSANSTLLRTNQAPSFAGPSHQYDHYKQQTGLPVGALDTLAVNPTTNLSVFRNTPELDFGAGDNFFDTSLGDDLMNGGPSSSRHASFGAASEMDLGSPDPEPLPAFFFAETTTSASAEFIDPSALAAPETTTPMPLPATPRAQGNAVGRLWPGMHQQQAALAKARQQQQQHQHHQRAMGSISAQQPLPQLDGATAAIQPVASQPPNSMAEERISRLLSSMRQASVAGSSDGGATPRADGHGSHSGRMRKDEEDMDEDERLLASEEGKKLSSKERRQLRNKVSARAFRSRRKEYIGQLEAELSAKGKENNDLRQENRALRDENTRLSDLTRMLLASPAFSGFLEQLSTNGASSAPAQTSSAAPPASEPVVGPSVVASRQPATAPAPAPTRKDVNPSQPQLQAEMEDAPLIGMTLVPDLPVDPATFDPAGTASWGVGALNNPPWGGYQQVFSLHELPEGPAVDQLDTSAFSGKTSSDSVSFVPSAIESKEEAPSVEFMPPLASEEKQQQPSEVATPSSDDTTDSDAASDLFSDASPTSEPSSEVTKTTPSNLSGKGESQITLTVPSDISIDLEQAPTSDDFAKARFQRFCNSIEAAFQRIGQMTSHL